MKIAEKAQKINALREQIATCTRCSLHKTRTNTVPGEGNVNTKIMFIGEAPGKNEDEQGKPFIGRAGNILDKLLESIELKREDIYICNILKCRPPDNRNPLAEEIHQCVGSLDIQIRVINPTIIATLGTFASTTIFQKFSLPMTTISAVAGQIFDVETPFGPKKIIPMFHPAVATYSPTKIEILKEHFQCLKPFINDVGQSDKASSGGASLVDDHIEVWR